MTKTDYIIEMEKETHEDIEDDDGSKYPAMSKPFDPVKIQIQPKTDTLRNIIERLREDEIDMNTDFQRNPDLWNNAKMSRLIESILIRFPLPSFYFDASDDNRWLVVDGLQRLSAVRKFVVENKLRLSGLDYLEDLRGYNYEDLPRHYKRRIDECPINMFQIMPGTPREVKYSLFKRINTGGIVLNNQEIRNALAKPRERAFLRKLTQNEDFINTVGDQSKRMTDQELVLRFIAFHSKGNALPKKNISVFLDDAMEEIAAKTEKELDELLADFCNAIKTCYLIFENRAFEKLQKKSNTKRKRKNASLFEVWMVSIANLSKSEQEKLIHRKNAVIDEFILLLNEEPSFDTAISIATQKHDHINTRHSKIRSLIQEVLND